MSYYFAIRSKWLTILAASLSSIPVFVCIQLSNFAQAQHIENAAYETDLELFNIIQREINENNFDSVDDGSGGRRYAGIDSNIRALEQEKYRRYYTETKAFIDSEENSDDLTCQSFYTFDIGDKPSVASISCQEFLAAAACKFSHKANLEVAALHCEKYSNSFDATLSRYKDIRNYYNRGGGKEEPYQDALRYRCFFGYNIALLDRDVTTESCLSSYANLQEELEEANIDSRSAVMSSSFELLKAISYIYLEQGKDDIALEMINSEIEYLEKNSLGQGFGGTNYSDTAKGSRLKLLGEIHFQSGRYQDSVRYYDELVSNKEKYGIRSEEEYDVRNKYAVSLFKNGESEKAETELRNVIESQEQVGPTGLVQFNSGYLRILDASRNSYDALQSVLIQDGRYEEALEIADRSRAFVFSRGFRSGELDRSGTEYIEPQRHLSIDEIRDEARIQNATIVFYSESNINGDSRDVSSVDRAEDEYVYIWVVKPDGNIVFESVLVDAVLNSSNAQLINISGSDLDKIIPFLPIVKVLSGLGIAALVFFILRANSKNRRSFYMSGAALLVCTLSISFTLSSETLRPVEYSEDYSLLSQAVDSASISTRGENIDQIFGGSICSSSESCLKKMYRLLIKPIEDELPNENDQHIIFVPDGAMHGLSFIALQSSDGRYLIDSYTTRSVPSVKALALLRLRAENRSTAVTENLVVGNPAMPEYNPAPFLTTKLDALPYAEEEANQVAEMLDTTAITGADATREAVIPKLTFANYIHLATHGLPHTRLDSLKNPSFALAPSDRRSSSFNSYNDGFLGTDDLYGIPLNGELAVLSACATISGTRTIEGNLSLARPFLANGIPSVVASLWSVNDASTAELMVAFYENLESTTDKAAALRAATLLIKQKYPAQPRLWAGFTLIGLSEMPEPESTVQSQIVGRKSCTYKASRGDFDTNTDSLIEATLSSSNNGFVLELVEDTGFKHKLQFDSNKQLQFATNASLGEPYGEAGWKLVSDSGLNIEQDGSFSISVELIRSGCSFDGRLEFLEDSKENWF